MKWSLGFTVVQSVVADLSYLKMRRRRKETNSENGGKGMYQEDNEDQTRWLFSDPGKRVMKWRNMVVLYNLTGSRMLFPSAWNHTEPPSAQTKGVVGGCGGGSGRMTDGPRQPLLCVDFSLKKKKRKVSRKHTPTDGMEMHTKASSSALALYQA